MNVIFVLETNLSHPNTCSDAAHQREVNDVGRLCCYVIGFLRLHQRNKCSCDVTVGTTQIGTVSK